MRGLLYRWIFGSLAALSPDTACRLGAAIGGLVFQAGIRRRVVSENMRRTLGLAGTARRSAARRSFRHLGATLVEMWTLRPGEVPATPMNPLWLERLLNQPQGTIFVTVHIGSWDVGGAAVAQRRPPVLAYAKAQSDRDMDVMVVAKRLEMDIQVIFARRGGSREMATVLRALRDGGRLALVADQMPTGEDGCEGHFLGVPTQLHLGPAVLARLTKARLVPAICLRIGPGQHKLFIGRPIEALPTDAETVQRCMDILGACIAAYPEQYFWQHRRFKRAVNLAARASEPWKHGLSLLVRGQT